MNPTPAPKRGRKATGRIVIWKTRSISASPEEWALWVRISEAQKMSLSAWVRKELARVTEKEKLKGLVKWVRKELARVTEKEKLKGLVE